MGELEESLHSNTWTEDPPSLSTIQGAAFALGAVEGVVTVKKTEPTSSASAEVASDCEMSVLDTSEDEEEPSHDQANRDLLHQGGIQLRCHSGGPDLREGAPDFDPVRQSVEMRRLSQCLRGGGQVCFNELALIIRSAAEEVADSMFARALRHRRHGEQHRNIKSGSAASTNRSHAQHTPQLHPHFHSSSEPVQLEVVETVAGSDGDLSAAVLATLPGDVCMAELHIDPLNGASSSCPGHADGGGVPPSNDLPSRDGDLVFHAEAEPIGDHLQSSTCRKTPQMSFAQGVSDAMGEVKAAAFNINNERKTRIATANASSGDLQTISIGGFPVIFINSDEEEVKATLLNVLRDPSSSVSQFSASSFPRVIQDRGSVAFMRDVIHLKIDEVVIKAHRENSLSMEAVLQHHTADEFSAVVMGATFPGAIDPFDGVTNALERVTFALHLAQYHEPWRSHFIRITRSTLSDSVVELLCIGPVADAFAGGCVDSEVKISFRTRSHFQHPPYQSNNQTQACLAVSAWRGKTEPPVVEARTSEGEPTGADPAEATQATDGSKTSSHESASDAALGDDDEFVMKMQMRGSFEPPLEPHKPDEGEWERSDLPAWSRQAIMLEDDTFRTFTVFGDQLGWAIGDESALLQGCQPTADFSDAHVCQSAPDPSAEFDGMLVNEANLECDVETTRRNGAVVKAQAWLADQRDFDSRSGFSFLATTHGDDEIVPVLLVFAMLKALSFSVWDAVFACNLCMERGLSSALLHSG